MKRIYLVLTVAGFAAASCQRTVVAPQQPLAQSAVYNIVPADWTTPDSGLSYSASLRVPELTTDIHASGAVLVYLSFGNNIYEAIPEVYQGISYGFITSPGYVTIDFHDINNAQITPPAGNVGAKVVLISAQQLMLQKGVNLKDYKAVQQAFHLR